MGEMAQATKQDVRRFRRIVEDIRKQHSDRGAFGRLLARLFHGYGIAKQGVKARGALVKESYGLSPTRQFLLLFADFARYGTYDDEFHLFRFWLSECRRERWRHFPLTTQAKPAIAKLIERHSAADAAILTSKSRFAKHCVLHKLPTANILAEIVDGTIAHLAAIPNGVDLFSKPAERNVGLGTRRWRRGQFVISELLQSLCEQSKGRLGPVVLQPVLTNHLGLAPLTNGSLSTLRIVTAKNPRGAIEFLPPVIRMPAGEGIVDNFAQGGLAAPIDLASGTVCGPAIRKDAARGTVTLDRHPDTGAQFEGHVIPFWQSALDLAVRAHGAFPSMIFVGWDVPILHDGPILLEGNAIWDVNLTVLPHGITLSDTQFIPYFDHYFGRSED